MKIEIAVYRHIKWAYQFVAECDKYIGDKENIIISEPMTVEFTMLPIVGDDVLKKMNIAVAQKEVDEAQEKLEALKNES